MKAALFVFLEHEYGFGFDDPVVIQFDDRESATDFAVQKLIESGEVVVRETDGLYETANDEDECIYEKKADVLDAWSDGLGLSEHFHIYECLDGESLKRNGKEA